MSVIVRVIRTYDIPVEANYGDSDEDLIERAESAVSNSEYAETAVILPQES